MKLISLKLPCRLSVFFAAVIFFSACSKDDPSPRQALLKVNIEQGYFPAEADTWIFLSDPNGNTIDVRNATDSTSINFVGVKHRSYILTIFKANCTA
jgi:hypothetical protein